MSSLIDTTALLRWIDALNGVDLHNYLDFVIGDTVVGAVHRSWCTLLREYPRVFLVDDCIRLHPRLDTPGARTEAVAEVLNAWCSAGRFPGWRDELYRVSTAFDASPLMSIERATASTFGILRYGAHVNGFVHKNDGLYLWVARRSLDKPEFPGKLDHIVAGGIPASLSAMDVVIKECREEANIPPELARQARPVSLLSYMVDEDVRRKRSLVFVYDLELPESFVPENTDGEVASFELWPVARVIETAVRTDAFKTNNNLVIIDLLLRYGYIGPDDNHYTEIAQRLRSPVIW